MESTHNPKPGVITAPAFHMFVSSSEAYDWVNVGEHPDTREPIRDGDVLLVPGEKLTGIAVEAWPTRIYGDDRGSFHDLDDSATWETFRGGRYKASARLARILTLPTSELLAESAAAARPPFIVQAYRRVTSDALDHRYVVVGRFRHDGYRYRSALIDVMTGQLWNVENISSAYLDHSGETPALPGDKINDELARRQRQAVDGPVELEAYVKSGGRLVDVRDDTRLF